MATKVISDAEIAAAAKAAGFSGDALTKIVAIALAESSGDIYAHNTTPPDDSYGLTQVNMYGSLGPARRKQFGLSSDSQLFDPATNMKAAFAISNRGKSFGPWSTYTSGAYFAFLPRARKASGSPASSVPTAGGTTTATQAGFGISGAGDFVSLVTDPTTWLRVGMFLGGGILLLIGLTMSSGAAQVLPVGKVAKIAAKVVK